jgi:hypothetical protein
MSSRPWIIDAAGLKGAPDHLADRLPIHRAESLVKDKNLSASTGRTALTQVIGDALPNLRQQGQLRGMPILALAEPQNAMPPVEVF